MRITTEKSGWCSWWCVWGIGMGAAMMMAFLAPASMAMAQPPILGPIFSDDFDLYADGPITLDPANQAWKGAGHDDCRVESQQLVLDENATDQIYAELPNQPYHNGNLYMSYQLRLTELPSADGDYISHFTAIVAGFPGNFHYAVGAVWVVRSPNNNGMYWVMVSNNGGMPNWTTPVAVAQDLALHTDYCIVLRYDIDHGTTRLWVNPFDESDPAGVDAADPVSIFPLNQFEFRQQPGIGRVVIDDLKIGPMFQSVYDATRLEFSGPPSSTILTPAATHTVVATLDVAAVNGPSDISGITVSITGTNFHWLSALVVYLDNGDGTFDPATDTQLSSVFIYSSTMQLSCYMGGGPLAVDPFAPIRLFVIGYCSSNIPDTVAFTFDVTDVLSSAPRTMGLPVAGNTVTFEIDNPNNGGNGSGPHVGSKGCHVGVTSRPELGWILLLAVLGLAWLRRQR